jgi:hypothetical protein
MTAITKDQIEAAEYSGSKNQFWFWIPETGHFISKVLYIKWTGGQKVEFQKVETKDRVFFVDKVKIIPTKFKRSKLF